MKYIALKLIFICITTITFSKNIDTPINSLSQKPSISSSVVVGENIFKNKLRKICRCTGGKFAQTYTQNKWKRLKDKGFFRISLYKICPKSVSVVKDQWIEPLYAFAYAYASDSGSFTP